MTSDEIYFVLTFRDVKKHLDGLEREVLEKLVVKINRGRIADRNPPCPTCGGCGKVKVASEGELFATYAACPHC